MKQRLNKATSDLAEAQAEARALKEKVEETSAAKRSTSDEVAALRKTLVRQCVCVCVCVWYDGE